MPSELWQRIRSARKYADLNQGDVAQVCGVGRPAVTLWESKDAARRTKPDIDQIQALAKITRLPVEYFLNDKLDPDSVWEIGKQHQAARTAAAATGSLAGALAAGGGGTIAALAGPVLGAAVGAASIFHSKETLFAPAFQYYVLRLAQEQGRDPEALEGAFTQRIPLAVASWAPSFFHGKVIAEIADRDADLDKVCANLLTAERATGSKLEKVILYRGSPAPDTTNMENLFGIHLFSVSDPREAAELIVARL